MSNHYQGNGLLPPEWLDDCAEETLIAIPARIGCPIEVEMTSTFKVGDRVINTHPGWDQFPHGTVTRVHSSGAVSVRYDNCLFYVSAQDQHTHDIGSEALAMLIRVTASLILQPVGPAICTKCNLPNEFANPSPTYICYECRR